MRRRLVVCLKARCALFASNNSGYTVIPTVSTDPHACAVEASKFVNSKSKAWRSTVTHVLLAARQSDSPPDMNKFRKTLLARTKDKKFKPRTHCVNDEHRLPPPYSTQEIQPRVFVLCEYGESVFNVDGNNEGIASEVRQELLQAVAAFDKECSSKTYAVALADAQLTNRVCPIERDPDAVALNMLQAKSRAVGDCRAFFVRDPGGPLVLAAISKVGSVDAQDKGIRRAGNRYREHQQFLQSI